MATKRSSLRGPLAKPTGALPSPPERTLTVTEVARSFADVIARAQHHGESVLLTKNNRPVARIVPVDADAALRPLTRAELARLWDDPVRPRLSPEEADAFEADLKAARAALSEPEDKPWGSS